MQKMLVFVPFFLVLSACGDKATTVVKEAPRPVYYAPVMSSSSADLSTFSGKAKAPDETILSFQVAGKVNEVNVELGDRVRKGQLVATIDPSDLNIQANQAVAQKKGSEAQVISAQTQVKSAETALITSKSNYQRIENLYANNSVSLADFEAAKSNYETAQSQYEAALANLEAARSQVNSSLQQVNAARNQLSYTRLIAPFDGIVTRVDIKENELVGSGTPILVVAAEGDPEVEVGVPDVAISRIQPRQEVSIVFSTLRNQTFKGIVKEVAYATGGAPTYPVTIRLVNASEDIRPGMAANVTFSLAGKGVDQVERLLVPASAVGGVGDGNFVFVLNPQDSNYYTVERRPIKVGTLTPNGMEIREGLDDGEFVATAGLSTLLEGMTVSLLEN